MVKNSPVKAGDIRDAGLIPGSGRSPGRGHGNLLQYSCLENPMDREAWWATVNGVTRVGHNLATKLPPPRTYGTLFFTKEAKIFNGAKTASSINGAGKPGQLHVKE